MLVQLFQIRQFSVGPTGIAAVVQVNPSEIRIQVPASTIDETIELAAGLTTKAAIAADFVTKFNANANLQVLFTVARV